MLYKWLSCLFLTKSFNIRLNIVNAMSPHSNPCFWVGCMLLLSCAFGANLHGISYSWDTLEEVPALVQVYSNDSLVAQVLAAEDGFYNISLDTGDYLVLFAYGDSVFETHVTLVTDLRLDAPLLPSEEDLFPGTELPPYESLGTPVGLGDIAETQSFPVAEIALLLVAIVALFAFFLLRKKKPVILGDAEKVLNVLKARNGKALQQDLVKDTGFSAAKVSILLTRLKKTGKIKKEKVGRDNIIELV